jgi:hypothetical protein
MQNVTIRVSDEEFLREFEIIFNGSDKKEHKLPSSSKTKDRKNDKGSKLWTAVMFVNDDGYDATTIGIYEHQTTAIKVVLKMIENEYYTWLSTNSPDNLLKDLKCRELFENVEQVNWAVIKPIIFAHLETTSSFLNNPFYYVDYKISSHTLNRRMDKI